jgi:hypothetical protein
MDVERMSKQNELSFRTECNEQKRSACNAHIFRHEALGCGNGNPLLSV